jgi:uncharacterized membrane protein
MKSKTTVVILIVSLAVNLLFIGGTIGFFLQEKPGPKFPTHLGKVLENLDSEKKGVMRQRLKEFREQSRPLHRDMRREQRALAKVILSDPFDQAAAREAFSRTQDSQIALQTHMFEQMVEVMADLDRRQRAALMRRVFRENNRTNPGTRSAPP